MAKRVSLREGAPGVASFLRAVALSNGAPLKQIAREVGLPIPVSTAIRRELESEHMLTRGSGVLLTDQGKAFVSEFLDLQASAPAQCEQCNGSGLLSPQTETVNQLQNLLEDAPPLDVALDQAPCTAETALRRAALMHKAGALEGRNILILGDDDSLSLAIPLYLAQQGRTSPVDNITVLELDPGRIEFLKAKTAALGANVSVLAHDIREPLPQSMVASFDTFQTDPPYTLNGAQLFLSRAAEALVPGPGALGFLSYAQPAMEDQFALLGIIQSTGFAVTDIQRNFNSYLGASILGSTGQLLSLQGLFVECTVNSKTVTKAIYTADNNKRRREYQCKSCRKVLCLGENSVPATIEQLKSAGCPNCGKTVFVRAGSGDTGHRRR